jgi:hypothetical protein
MQGNEIPVLFMNIKLLKYFLDPGTGRGDFPFLQSLPVPRSHGPRVGGLRISSPSGSPYPLIKYHLFTALKRQISTGRIYRIEMVPEEIKVTQVGAVDKS